MTAWNLWLLHTGIDRPLGEQRVPHLCLCVGTRRSVHAGATAAFLAERAQTLGRRREVGGKGQGFCRTGD